MVDDRQRLIPNHHRRSAHVFLIFFYLLSTTYVLLSMILRKSLRPPYGDDDPLILRSSDLLISRFSVRIRIVELLTTSQMTNMKLMIMSLSLPHEETRDTVDRMH